MPELPEVEVVRRGLEKILGSDTRIVKFEFLRANLRDVIPKKKFKGLEDALILKIERRGKYLLWHTDAGIILSHLGMTGTWRVAGLGQEMVHDHIYIYLSKGLRLAYRDPRRFGIFDFWPLNHKNLHPKLQDLGVEPLSEEFSGTRLWNSLRKKSASLKASIMDQNIVVGVGNIYASEALFLTRIKPMLPAGKLSLARAESLVTEIKKVLEQAILAGGSSISDFKKAEGHAGDFQNSFQVYDRAGLECFVCGSKIRSKVLAGRNTFWCPICQQT